MDISQKSLGEILKIKRIITDEQLNKASAYQNKLSIRFDEAITRLGYASPEDIIRCLAEQFDFKVVNPLDISIPDDVLNSIPKNIVEKYHVIPIKKENGLLIVVTSDPLDISIIENLRFTLNTDIECVLSTRNNIENAIKKYYKNIEDVISFDGIVEELKETEDEAGKFFEHMTGVEENAESPVVKLVMHIIREAVKTRASDIHIEPLSSRIRIRVRIDGVCQEVHSIAKYIHEELISRIKILSNIDITEKRKPQDGRINFEVDGNPIDIRVSIIPTTCGESAVLRLLEKSSTLIKLKSVGFSDSDYNSFKSVLKNPNGIILVTGPTGSGKSTTLYAALNEINKREKKIITVEDPIEYNIPDINQCEVNEKLGLTFPKVLRSILRQDPNVVVIGEIRDVETAEIAVSAALTGHLVLSTLHTNDAPSAITRLTDMGVKPFLVSSSILAIAAQRLVRVICPKCKAPHKIKIDSFIERDLNLSDFDNTEFCHGTGCDYCNKTGYHSRTGIFEFMSITPELGEAIHRKVTTSELSKIAHSTGMTTLMEDGLRLVRAQITTLDEVMRVSIE
ncbi:MAG: GspE/PulE family protein [Candidatus Scalinduaceae bacterium]